MRANQLIIKLLIYSGATGHADQWCKWSIPKWPKNRSIPRTNFSSFLKNQWSSFTDVKRSPLLGERYPKNEGLRRSVALKTDRESGCPCSSWRRRPFMVTRDSEFSRSSNSRKHLYARHGSHPVVSTTASFATSLSATELIEVSREYKMPFCITFVELKKSFHSVEIEAVLKAMVNQVYLLNTSGCFVSCTSGPEFHLFTTTSTSMSRKGFDEATLSRRC